MVCNLSKNIDDDPLFYSTVTHHHKCVCLNPDLSESITVNEVDPFLVWTLIEGGGKKTSLDEKSYGRVMS